MAMWVTAEWSNRQTRWPFNPNNKTKNVNCKVIHIANKINSILDEIFINI